MTSVHADRRCRSCGSQVTQTFADLGEMPLANSYLDDDDLAEAEPRYPLHARVCGDCLLVQIDAVATPEAIFSDYAYFSSYSESWVNQARAFAHSAIDRFGVDATSRVVEVASNDGYLLRHFVEKGIPALGIEPAANVAEVARACGVETDTRFFGTDVALDLREGDMRADLLVGNNVLAHVPDLNDFVAGLAIALAPEGVLSLEFPHLLRLMEGTQFDTIYHEHFSYFSFLSANRVLVNHGLRVFDVEELPTHGGSLRVLACHESAAHPEMATVARIESAEAAGGLRRVETYATFQDQVDRVRASLRAFLDESRSKGESVVAYGAAAKGNTLLNYVGVTANDVAYVVDRSRHKQGRYLPGSHLPIRDPNQVKNTCPDVLLILAWNLLDEITAQMGFVREWGCQFAVPIPELGILP